jgi:hypothetical protein
MVTGFKMFQRTNTHNSKIKAAFAKLIYKVIIDDIHTLLFAPLSMLRKIARNLEKYVTQGRIVVQGVVSQKTSSTDRKGTDCGQHWATVRARGMPIPSPE